MSTNVASVGEVTLKTVKSLQLRDFAVKLCVSITLGLALLALGELVAFWRLRSLPPAPEPLDHQFTESIYRGQDWIVKYRREFLASRASQYQSYVVWRRKPFHGETISVDAEGIRRTFHSQCDGKTYTVWMFGDSALWGTGAPDWSTIPSFLAELYEKAGQPICVKNYGESGWVTTQEVIKLFLDLKRASKKPDLVIFYNGPAEAFLRYQQDQPDVHHNFVLIKQKMERTELEETAGFEYLGRTNTYRALKRVAESLRLRNEAPPGNGGGPEEGVVSAKDASVMAQAVLTNHLKNMEIVEALARQYTFRYAFFWHSTLLTGEKPMTAEEESMTRAVEKGNPGFGGVCRATYDVFRTANRPHLYYLGDIFKDHRESLYENFSHTGPEGNRLTAARIFQILHQSGSR